MGGLAGRSDRRASCRRGRRIVLPVAIVNAVLDALAPVGIEDIDMPRTGETVWRALQGLPPRRIEG
jgi:hypothetical protein